MFGGKTPAFSIYRRRTSPPTPCLLSCPTYSFLLSLLPTSLPSVLLCLPPYTCLLSLSPSPSPCAWHSSLLRVIDTYFTPAPVLFPFCLFCALCACTSNILNYCFSVFFLLYLSTYHTFTCWCCLPGEPVAPFTSGTPAYQALLLPLLSLTT